MHLPGIPIEKYDNIRKAIKTPEGTIELTSSSGKIFKEYNLLEIPAGSIFFQLERDSQNNLHFIHTSPGTGTRIATVNLNPVINSEKLKVVLRWNHEKIYLDVFSHKPDVHIEGVGKSSQRRFMVGNNGNVFRMGDERVEISNVTVYSGGKLILESPAIDAWNSTIDASKILLGKIGTNDNYHERICANLTIIMLVTGFEAYCKRRFLELETEGINPNFEELIIKFLSKEERKRGEDESIRQDAAKEGISPTKKLINQRRIDFQNYDRCKTAYNKGYRIKFGSDVNIPNAHFGEIKQLIKFRHRLVHVSPSLNTINPENDIPEQIHTGKNYAQKSMKIIDEFIQELHKTTLKLRS